MTQMDESFEQLFGLRRKASVLPDPEREMAERYAAAQMPEDIRERARTWGMEAYCEVLWNSAFRAGYREAMLAREGPRDGR